MDVNKSVESYITDCKGFLVTLERAKSKKVHIAKKLLTEWVNLKNKYEFLIADTITVQDDINKLSEAQTKVLKEEF